MSALAKNPQRFVETEIEDETVVMVLDTGDFFSLRETARAIWQLIDGKQNRDDILARLVEQYDAPEAALGADIDRFLTELRAKGLLNGH